jgi:hypothetical protein
MRLGMLKFKGKPHELRELTKCLCKQYGEKQKIIAVYIMMQKEEDLKHDGF